MSKIKSVAIILVLSFLSLFSSSKLLAADHCDDQYFINKTLANGATWDMCWAHNKNQGIIYHHIYYTPKNDTRRMVLFEASIAQIHVPYDDNGARFHDVSDFGLGNDGGSNNNLVSLNPAECANGTLGYFNNEAAVCNRVISNGSAYRKGSNQKDSQLLKVFSISKVGQYIYGIDWDFHDDGRILPTIVATGALQRFDTTGNTAHGWMVDSGNRVGLAHMHNFYWRLDFDIDGTGKNDIVQEINYDTWQGKRYKKITNFTKEEGRSVNPYTMRSWVVKDSNTTNRKGHKISYEIRLNESGQREVGPSFEPFTNNDFYVTQAKDCELFASHNAGVNNCSTNNLSEFVNNESIVNEDIITWVGVSFYHMPRSEDAPKMDAHVSGFELIPRDWHTTNPNLESAPQISLRLSAGDDFTSSASTTILIDVLSNDTGQAIEINTLDNPANGTASIVNGKVQYTPDAGFIGTDIFWYSIKDSSGSIYGTKINVEVTPAVVNNVNTGSGGGSISIVDLLALILSTLLLGYSSYLLKRD
jgi:Cu2+-containing amine oxidase